MTNAARILELARSDRADQSQTEPFSIADAIVAAAGIAVVDATGQQCYLSGIEAVLEFEATRAASAALVAGTPVVLGTLVAALHPKAPCESLGYVDSGAATSAGKLVVDAAGVVSFVPFVAAAAAAGMVFHARGLRVGPPASLVSSDVA